MDNTILEGAIVIDIEKLKSIVENQIRLGISEYTKTHVRSLIHIDEMDFSTRTRSAFRRECLKTVADVIAYSEKNGLGLMRNFGSKCRSEVIGKLASIGIRLMDEKSLKGAVKWGYTTNG